MMYPIKKRFNPAIFQGKNKREKYFEGWYYRITDGAQEHTYAIIPGVSIGEWDVHAFIQILDYKNQVSYFHFNISEFSFNENKFEIMIGENYFSKNRVRLNLMGKYICLQGDLSFCNIMEYPTSVIKPGIMGAFLYIPFMECYHEIISIKHEITGQLKICGNNVDFTNGIGYIEKNWGSSMPKSWVWYQSNHFQPDDVSLFLSVAKIPFLGSCFTGFLSIFRYKERIFTFTSYNGSWISRILSSENRVKITFRDCRFRLETIITYKKGGTLKAPIGGQMCRGITETLDAVVKIRFSDRAGNILYEGIGINGGFEIVE